MKPQLRWLLWCVLLAGAAALVITDRGERTAGGIVEAVAPHGAPTDALPKRSDAATRESADAPTILAIRPRGDGADADNAFAVRDWTPPPIVSAAKPAPPPPPTAPPFPYVVFGKQLENGAWQVFLRRDQLIVVVKAAETLDDQYRVEEIRPPVMTVTYLPLRERQTIPIGGAE